MSTHAYHLATNGPLHPPPSTGHGTSIPGFDLPTWATSLVSSTSATPLDWPLDEHPHSDDDGVTRVSGTNREEAVSTVRGKTTRFASTSSEQQNDSFDLSIPPVYPPRTAVSTPGAD